MYESFKFLNMTHLLNITQRQTLFLITQIAFAVLLGAFYYEYFEKLVPCKLCLEQRYAYYFALIFGGAIYLYNNPRFIKPTLKLLAVVFIFNMWLGLYHAGAEWAFWPGPSSCAGAGQPTLNSVQDLLKSLPTTKVIDCTAVQWRLFGLSFAGYNTLISAALALFAFYGVMQKR
jgi:disulfide bond formation protein DsbB